MKAKHIGFMAVAAVLWLCVFVVIMPIYIDWLDSFFGLWSIWSCLIFTSTASAITIVYAAIAAAICIKVFPPAY